MPVAHHCADGDHIWRPTARFANGRVKSWRCLHCIRIAYRNEAAGPVNYADGEIPEEQPVVDVDFSDD